MFTLVLSGHNTAPHIDGVYISRLQLFFYRRLTRPVSVVLTASIWGRYSLPSMKTGTKLGLVALVLAIGTTVLWFRMTGTVGLPGTRTGFVIAWIGAAGLGVYSYFRGIGIFGAVPPALAVLVSGFLLFTVYISPQVLDESRSIKVGDTIPQFTAPDGHGEIFDSSSLSGHLVLVKFFRAHW